MLSNHYRQEARRSHEAIARLQRDKSREVQRIAELTRRINSLSQAVSRATNPAALNSKLREIERLQADIARCEKKVADIEGKLAREQEKLSKAQQNLAREEQREQERQQREADRLARHNEQRFRNMAGKISQHDSLHARTFATLRKLNQLPEKIVVLFLAANPIDQKQLRLDEEVRAIAEMIQKSKHRNSVKLESCWAVRPRDLLQALNEHEPCIVHFSGHGSDQDEIVFQNDSGEAKLVSKDAIIQTMMASSGEIRLVFFNTCYSRNQAEAVLEHVEAAIGMKTSIGDKAARIFASQFYSAIGFGLSVKRAFAQAKASLMLEGIPEEETPELFIHDGLDPDKLILVRPAPDMLAAG